jgi:hypothetical protein
MQDALQEWDETLQRILEERQGQLDYELEKAQRQLERLRADKE